MRQKVEISPRVYYDVVQDKYEQAMLSGCSDTVVMRDGSIREKGLLRGKNGLTAGILPQRDSIIVEYTKDPKHKISLSTGVQYESPIIRTIVQPDNTELSFRDMLQPMSKIAVLNFCQMTRNLLPDTQKKDYDSKSINSAYENNLSEKTQELSLASLALKLVQFSLDKGGDYVEEDDDISLTAASTDIARFDMSTDPLSLELLGELSLTMSMLGDNGLYILETMDASILDDEFHFLIEEDSCIAFVDTSINQSELSELKPSSSDFLKRQLIEAIPHPL